MNAEYTSNTSVTIKAYSHCELTQIKKSVKGKYSDHYNDQS